MSFAARLQRIVRRHGRTFTIRSAAQGTDYPNVPGLLLAGGQQQIGGGLATVSVPSVVFAYPDLPVVPTTASRIKDGAKTYQISAVRLPEAEGGPVAAICELAGS